MKKIFSFLLKHKFWVIFILIILSAGGYYGYKKYTNNKTAASYITEKAKIGNITSSVSGSGQISASNEIAIKAKVSGELMNLNAKVGQKVKKGDLIAWLDASDARKTVRDAEISLESAELSYKKTNEPATQLQLTQAENSLAQAQENLEQAKNDLIKNYEDGFNTVTAVFLELPQIMTDLESIIMDKDFDLNQPNVDWYAYQGIAANAKLDDQITKYQTQVKNSLAESTKKYDTNFENYKSASRLSSTSTIENLISQTYETTKVVAETVKKTKNYIDFVNDAIANSDIKLNIPAEIATQQTSLTSYTSKTNTELSNLLSALQTLENDKKSIVSYERTITEKTQSLEELKAPTDELDLKTQALSLEQKRNALIDAQTQLANYYIRAPFDGSVADVAVNLNDDITNGASIATIITEQKVANLTLSETDVVNVKVGQKTTLTFDAIEGLEIEGTVAEVDTVGTVSQGVVSYGIKITFDSKDERIKPGMSVSANIITESKENVLTVKSSAIKSMGERNFVQILNNGKPERKTVTVGISDDAKTEITGGLNEGDEVIVQTITGTATKTTTSKNTSSSNRGGGNAMMMMGGGRPD